MHRVLLTPLAEFLQFYLPLGFLFIFTRPVVLALTRGTLQFYQIVLTHNKDFTISDFVRFDNTPGANGRI